MMKSTYGTGCFALLNTGTNAGRARRTGCSPPSPISSTASAPTRSKARSSSPAPPCSGCATGSASSAAPPRPGRSPSSADSGAGRLSRAGLRRARRALLGRGRARRAVRADAQHRAAGTRARRARKRLLPDPDLFEAMRADWPDASAAAHRAARRRRHGRVRLDDAAARRHPRRAGRPAGVLETTALGAAYLAGSAAGVFPEPARFADHWRLERRFTPAMAAETRTRKLAGWKRAVTGVLASDPGLATWSHCRGGRA